MTDTGNSNGSEAEETNQYMNISNNSNRSSPLPSPHTARQNSATSARTLSQPCVTLLFGLHASQHILAANRAAERDNAMREDDSLRNDSAEKLGQELLEMTREIAAGQRELLKNRRVSFIQDEDMNHNKCFKVQVHLVRNIPGSDKGTRPVAKGSGFQLLQCLPFVLPSPTWKRSEQRGSARLRYEYARSRARTAALSTIEDIKQIRNDNNLTLPSAPDEDCTALYCVEMCLSTYVENTEFRIDIRRQECVARGPLGHRGFENQLNTLASGVFHFFSTTIIGKRSAFKLHIESYEDRENAGRRTREITCTVTRHHPALSETPAAIVTIGASRQ
eukprot:IDg21738t1